MGTSGQDETNFRTCPGSGSCTHALHNMAIRLGCSAESEDIDMDGIRCNGMPRHKKVCEVEVLT